MADNFRGRAAERGMRGSWGRSGDGWRAVRRQCGGWRKSCAEGRCGGSLVPGVEELFIFFTLRLPGAQVRHPTAHNKRRAPAVPSEKPSRRLPSHITLNAYYPPHQKYIPYIHSGGRHFRGRHPRLPYPWQDPFFIKKSATPPRSRMMLPAIWVRPLLPFP